MKCPKCSYLGFETGDRCRNCGYDFSLLATDPTTDGLDPDLTLRPADDGTGDGEFWLDRLDQTASDADLLQLAPRPEVDDFRLPDPVESALVETPATVKPAASVVKPFAPLSSSPSRARADSALPLFAPAVDDDDEPLVKLPAAPRPPLAVRRTPDTPRLRAVPKPLRQPDPEPEPELEFAEEKFQSAAARRGSSHAADFVAGEPGGPGARMGAAVIDHLILSAIDAAVVYFTLRMAGLQMEDWRAVPVAPLVAFLCLIKFAYFWSFTAVGGQTIGKMAARLHVVTDVGGQRVDGACALQRTLAATGSVLTLGVGFFLMLGSDRRALHDRVAHTRVVRPQSA